MKWRLVDSDLSEPAFTVAADEAIALARSRGEVPNTLHLYRRSKPTVSLGYFQKVEESADTDFCRKNGISVIRRATGGSAIYTDENHLIYGLAVDDRTLPSDREKSVALVCSALVAALDELGIESAFRPVNDILIGGRKVSGSAQMRRWGVVLQHGTLILDNRADVMAGALRMDLEKIRSRGLSPTNYVTSLKEALGTEPELPKVKAAIVHGFERVFGTEIEPGELTAKEIEEIRHLTDTKYGRDEWNFKR